MGDIENPKNYMEFFKRATGYDPYPYQQRIAELENLPSLIEIPTGLGKTAGIILGWIWHRKFHSNKTVKDNTPRRLVYCLPMRTLVEQTKENTKEWLTKLNLENDITVTILMGGESLDKWDIYPEKDIIIIGTQDMLLSRALNRGYGMNRYRWPIHFGLLNNDCLWVMDEIQLMGSGLSTSTQLQAFRESYGTIGNTKTIWMSATINEKWVQTVDYNRTLKDILKLNNDDLGTQEIKKRLDSKKSLELIELNTDKYNEELGIKVLNAHIPGKRTLVIFNTVSKAVKFYKFLKNQISKLSNDKQIDIILIHSHFRTPERNDIMKKLLNDDSSIVIATQVVEAGVDFSSNILFTEIAPLSSLIQRFGRCNRYGEFTDAKVYIFDQNSMQNYLPYDEEMIKKSKDIINKLNGTDITTQHLQDPNKFPLADNINKYQNVLRKKDVFELFDTTTEMSGKEIDISRYVRDLNDTNVQVFWRNIKDPKDISSEKLPDRNELCPAPTEDILKLLKNKDFFAFIWDWYNGDWKRLTAMDRIVPGMTIMLDSSQGHYSEIGWDSNSKKYVTPINTATNDTNDSYNADKNSLQQWKDIAKHTDEVVDMISIISANLPINRSTFDILKESARWHDAGKAHIAFQSNIKKDPNINIGLIAKAPDKAWLSSKLSDNPSNANGRRKYFRHEMVSAILALMNGKSDILAYLVASHHGKVRLTIRSMPGEYVPPDPTRKFARGVWDGDQMPEIDLGGNITVPSTKLDLSYMELGIKNNSSSWLSRVLDLCEDNNYGIFRLGYLESILRAADERASGGI